ncbi:MAG: hypothetical protein JWN99_2895 [Ilumatobacteraceae bacterium]|nr:hypothetical protein [Ilumatobacteraceae bacterium]
MAKQDASTKTTSTTKPPQIGELVELVKGYVQQETLGPLRGAARWLAAGAVGAVFMGFGSIMIVLGVLRLIQNEFAPTFRGQWMSLLPYVIAFALAVAIIGLAVSRIAKTSLHPNDRPG